MQWLELTIHTTSEGIELLEAVLTMNGFDSFTVNDTDDFSDFLENNRDYWDVVDNELSEKMKNVSEITLYLENNSAAAEERLRLQSLLNELSSAYPELDFGSLQVTVNNVTEEDWENNWKQYYQPIEIGEKLIVVPEWMKSDNPERIPVYLDPGMIFGTGAHASTQMCMEQLETLISGGETVLDLGSGSGILSITALLLGAGHATGIDVDPKAEDIARENAGINGIGCDRFTALTGNVITGRELLRDTLSKKYDVVCMNIFADVIIPMTPILPEVMHSRSVVIFSGVLDFRYPEVEEAVLAAGLKITGFMSRNDWCCFTAVLK